MTTQTPKGEAIWQSGCYWAVWYCEYEPYGTCDGEKCNGYHTPVASGGPTTKKSALAAMRRCYRAHKNSSWSCWAERMGAGGHGCDSLGIVREVIA
jgi:hypothetical protein